MCRVTKVAQLAKDSERASYEHPYVTALKRKKKRNKNIYKEKKPNPTAIPHPAVRIFPRVRAMCNSISPSCAGGFSRCPSAPPAAARGWVLFIPSAAFRPRGQSGRQRQPRTALGAELQM